MGSFPSEPPVRPWYKLCVYLSPFCKNTDRMNSSSLYCVSYSSYQHLQLLLWSSVHHHFQNKLPACCLVHESAAKHFISVSITEGKKKSNLNRINFFSFESVLFFVSSDGWLCLIEISSDVLLELVSERVSKLGKLSPHPLLLKRMKTSRLLDCTVGGRAKVAYCSSSRFESQPSHASSQELTVKYSGILWPSLPVQSWLGRNSKILNEWYLNQS